MMIRISVLLSVAIYLLVVVGTQAINNPRQYRQSCVRASESPLAQVRLWQQRDTLQDWKNVCLGLIASASVAAFPFQAVAGGKIDARIPHQVEGGSTPRCAEDRDRIRFGFYLSINKALYLHSSMHLLVSQLQRRTFRSRGGLS
jgi:hypothetical protein